MKLEDAIEQLESTVVQALTPCQGWTNTEAQALRIVLERAKEKPVYAATAESFHDPDWLEKRQARLGTGPKPVYVLGEEERKTLALMRSELARTVEEVDAITAALALQEPFTRGEAMRMQRWAAEAWAKSGPWSVADDALRAKLSAYIDALPK